jgi:hypothetical protein
MLKPEFVGVLRADGHCYFSFRRCIFDITGFSYPAQSVFRFLSLARSNRAERRHPATRRSDHSNLTADQSAASVESDHIGLVPSGYSTARF